MPDIFLVPQNGSAWQQFFARYFALLNILDPAQTAPSPHGQDAAENP